MAHLLAPLLFGVGAHGAGKCVPGAPGPGREAGEPDSEPAGGDVGLGSQPPRHKDMPRGRGGGGAEGEGPQLPYWWRGASLTDWPFQCPKMFANGGMAREGQREGSPVVSGSR